MPTLLARCLADIALVFFQHHLQSPTKDEAAGKLSLCLLKAWGMFTITDPLGPVLMIIIVIFLVLCHLWQYPLSMGHPQQPVPLPSELTAAVDK